LQPCACVRSGVHMQRCRCVGVANLARARPANRTVLALGGALRIRTRAVRLCGSGSAGLVAAHESTHTVTGDAILRSKPQIRPLLRDDAPAA
jgi:hypothetical protein